MKVKEFGLPRPHIIIENFLPDKTVNAFLKEATELDKWQIGLYNIDGKDILKEEQKKASEIFLDTIYQDRSKSIILSTLDEILWSKKMIQIYENARYPIFNTLTQTKTDNTHLIRYVDGDHYDFHVDKAGFPYGFLTMSYMFCSKPQKFAGGDFILKYKNEEKTIPFKRNTLIIFPRQTLHKVTPIILNSSNPKHNRYTIQIWNQ